MTNSSSIDHAGWYRGQTIFLTGATGSLGGCLLYKLVLQLPTKKVYALCRGSIGQALGKWEASMPGQIDQILDSGKVQCVIGDMTLPDFGLKDMDLDLLRQEVTVVIHAAADLSLLQDLPTSIKHNYLPAIRLVEMIKTFNGLRTFLFISSIAACTFLPEGPIEERLYRVAKDEESPEAQAKMILTSGQSPYRDEFPVSYAQAKYLAERTILNSDVPFTVLVVRPSSIGPAIKDPRAFYGPEDAIPAHTFIRLLLGNRDYRQWSDIRKWQQDIIVDEIPVDIAANTCLLHISSGTSGVVHAAAQLYKVLTVREYSEKCRLYTPNYITHQLAKANMDRKDAFVGRVRELSDGYQRAWRIECQRSESLRSVRGPLAVQIPEHDFESTLKVRVEKQSKKLLERLNHGLEAGRK